MPITTRLRLNKKRVEPSEPVVSDYDEIARVAYALFETRGRRHGHDKDDWFDAQRLLQQRRRSGNGPHRF